MTKPKAEDWLISIDNKPKTKKPRKKDPCTRAVPSSCMVRIAEGAEIWETPRVKNSLYASAIGDKDWDITAELIRFFKKPVPELRSLSLDLYAKQSSVKHAVWQERYHNRGILHPCCTDDEGNFIEPRCFFPEHGISGKIDWVLPDPKYLSAFGAKTSKKLPDIQEFFSSDIKESDSKQVGDMVPEIVSQKYMTQLSLYAEWVGNEGVGSGDKAFFFYLNRDKPMMAKYFEVKKDEKLIDLAKKRADEFWSKVRARDIPGVDKDWIEEEISKQPDREWNPLSEIKNETS